MENSLRILSVDDEPAVALSMRFVFGRPTYELATAQDGETALAKLASEAAPFDVVITDNNMPGVSGVELVRELRARHFPGKIMVLSAHLSTEIRGAYESLGVDAMVEKPFDVKVLRRTLDSLAA